MDDIPLFLLPVLVFVLIIAAIIYAEVRRRKREKERTLLLQSSANLLGWQFGEVMPLNWIPNLDKFPLFNQGHSKSINNMMYGEMNATKTALFDYVYVIGHGKHRSTHYQSVIYFEPRKLELPQFSLRPEHTLHKIIAAFGYQDIDFGNRPTFSSKYLLRGLDEQAIRNTFTDSLLAFYEMNPGICTDGGGNQLFFFRPGFRTPPHEAQSFINWGAQMQSLFRGFS